MRSILCLLVLALLGACSNSDRKSIPASVGVPGDIYLVMDSAQWRGRLGDVIDSVFAAEMPGLPRKEGIFKLRWINPRKLSDIIRQRRNLLFVMTLDNKGVGSRIIRGSFTPESIQQIRNSPEDFFRSMQDVYAHNQQVMYLFSQDEAGLINRIRAHAEGLTSIFANSERERLSRSLFKSGEQKNLSAMLNKDFKCQLRIPFGYKMAEKGEDFFWLRQINPRDDKDIFIARKKYESQNDFKRENLIRFRDEICKKHLYEDPEKSDTYLVTETNVPFIPVTSDTVNFHGRFAMNLRGLWRSNSMGMGGPFLGFALVDEATQQFYYIEGFTYGPSRDQREIMRELETILYTFGTSQDIAAK